MKFLWHVKLYATKNGFRVEIAGGGQTVTGNGPSVAKAFRAADMQLVVKPPFDVCDFVPGIDITQVQP